MRLLGQLGHPRLSESSGVAASPQFPGVLWTHNDGGGGRKQMLYAVTREGRTLAELLVTGAALVDWEDIAIDDQRHLYVGDLGNNDLKRRELAVYQLDEPDPNAHVLFVQIKRSWRLRFPGEPFDCESLFVWEHHGYVVSKVFKDAPAQVFRFPLTNELAAQTLELIATTKLDSPVTGATISSDGRLLAMVAKSGAFVYKVNGDVSRVARSKAHQTKFRHEHIEGCTFVPEGLLATAESREIYLFTEPAFRTNRVSTANGKGQAQTPGRKRPRPGQDGPEPEPRP